MSRIWIVACIFVCFYSDGVKTRGKSENYDVLIKAVSGCDSPRPPLAPKLALITLSDIYNVKGISLLKGNVTVREAVPFRNFNGRTFFVNDTGHRELKFEVKRVTCRNFFAATVLQYSNISYTKKDCIVTKGFYPYIIDLNKVSHMLPVWHDQGKVVHQLQLVVGGATGACQEVLVENRAQH